MTTLKEVFDAHFAEVKFDKKLIDALYRFQVWFLNRDAEHLGFFGSNLIGVHAIRWRTSEDIKFFREVVDIDPGPLERDLAKVDTVVLDHAVASNTVNLTLMYVIHRVLTETSLSQKQRDRGSYDAALIFFYKCIALRQSEYFHFPADPRVAQAAYARLSNKPLIKRLGSWRAVMEYRAKALLDEKGLHYKDLVTFDDGDRIAYAVTDSEGAIRSMYKIYCREFHLANGAGQSVQSSSATVIDGEGVEKLKDKTRSTERYIAYIRQAILDVHGFVNPELVEIISDINTNTSRRMLTATATWLSVNYSDAKWHKKIDDWIVLVIVHSFHLLNEMGEGNTKDYPTMLVTLKNLYLSTRSNDAELLKIRKLGDELIKAANGRVNNSLAMATRTAIILYVTLRAIVSHAKAH